MSLALRSPARSVELDALTTEALRRLLLQHSAKRFEALANLPDISSEERSLLGRRVILSVWHDVLASGEHRVVVQACRPSRLGISYIDADGFVASHDGQRAITWEELAPFT